MNTLKQYFDDFSIAARIKPAVTACFPFLVIAIYKGFLDDDFSEAGITFALAIVLIGFAAYIVREWGKAHEEKMVRELNGLPTTIILRFSDDTIDSISKLRYHQWLSSKIDFKLPSSLEEEATDSQSDSKYASAMSFLRTYANSHREELPRVYQELKKYNFWRNLYGCKRYALITYILVMIREVLVIDSFNLNEVLFVPFPKYGIFLGVFVWSILFCLVVTKRTVKRNAYDYAKALLETVETLSQQAI